jgi:hypothetical protein
MPHLFRPHADTVARSILIAILVVPFLVIGAGYWLSASPYETDQTLTLDQPVPFSHQHHVGGLGLDAAIATPRSRRRRSPACRRRTLA